MIFLGAADILSAGLLGLKVLQVNLPVLFMVLPAGYLILKNLIFGINLAGVLDLLAAGSLVLGIYFILPQQFFSLIAVVLGFKGAQSIFIGLI